MWLCQNKVFPYKKVVVYAFMGVLVHFGKSYIYFGNRVPAVLIMLVELLKDACPFLFDMMT